MLETLTQQSGMHDTLLQSAAISGAAKECRSTPNQVGVSAKTDAFIVRFTLYSRRFLKYGFGAVNPSSRTLAYRILTTLDTGRFCNLAFRYRLVIHAESYHLLGSNRTHLSGALGQARDMVDSIISNYTMRNTFVPLDT